MRTQAIKKYLAISFFLTILTVISYINFARTPVMLDGSDVTKISRQYPVVFLIRHGERCDRSQNKCLSGHEGITVNGANQARDYGKLFNNMFPSYGLYSTDTLRTVQTATYFSGGKTPVIPEMSTCDDDAINNILKMSQKNKVTVIFTHKHCLSKIAKKMKNWQLKSDYLETLVLHRDNNKLILDGVLIPHNLLH
ncbi:lipopolysaccharide core heptose(II)-phosphate phosphatase [Escherichia coli]|uniref:lipopolysaccharide core heptose(II)-phosphate phosphatase n=1 Tax=Escherichia coli TaxID=562 RepID=UPI000CFB6504|nr:lipopolysaccharide core heptose(II)-phosphate phosphatase [Escherichia coli]EEY3529799.1 lipopolysaccharide core heptose(II)-phosphate phosphatase [Escherichia coli]EFK8287188.1 lipopolysaccharide core heptose(II)-phosphate phosphatase [Escherichia coli]EFK8681740.1 lipopolysaccharide core heptose(II)-phosphate phosphatase [Escherichia coli]EFN7310773.1 lipopolysaccharide core heptose(II)-phosphate phosphatase [Escherichia coli]EFN7699072.1 lipopolysaccharide core heptose(II)-phosphate phos